MKKGLLALLAAVTLCASSAFANAPVVSDLPDVTIGDQEDNNGTDNNFFVYTNAFEFRQFVNDPDDAVATLKWSFDEGDPATAWFSVNNKGAVHVGLSAQGADAGGNAPHLNPGANEIQIGSNGFATFRDIVFSPGTGPLTAAFPSPTDPAKTAHADGKVVTFFVADSTTVTKFNDIIVRTVDNAFDAVSGGIGFKVYSDDEFTTRGTWIYTGDSPSSAIGRGIDNAYLTGQALRLRTYTASINPANGAAVRSRQGGFQTDPSGSVNDIMPYTAVGADNYVRVKYYIYATGMANPAAKNQIPTASLRASSGYALTSNLTIQGHNNGLSAGDAIRDDICPSTNAALPSIYRVDYDPPDVPAMSANPIDLGIYRGFYLVSQDPQENGDLVMEESVIGTYPASLVPDSGGTVLATLTGTALGSATNGTDQWDAYTHSFPAPVYEGSPGVSNPTDSQEPVITVNSSGVNINSSPTPSTKIGIAQHYVLLNANNALRPRIAADKQYKMRFHLTSTAAANTQTSFWLYAQTVDFAYNPQIEFGGTRLFAGGLTNAHNLCAAQASPGTGTAWTSGDYNVMFVSPLTDPGIRQDVTGDLATKFPQLNAQPGFGQSGTSFKDIEPGLIMIDSLNAANPDSSVEVGNVTVTSVEVREYNKVAD